MMSQLYDEVKWITRFPFLITAAMDTDWVEKGVSMSKGRQRRPRHVIGGPELPKGAIPLPTGGYQLPGSTSIFRDRHGKHHGITVSGVVRDEIDIKRFTHALLDVVKRMQDNERDQAA